LIEKLHPESNNVSSAKRLQKKKEVRIRGKPDLLFLSENTWSLGQVIDA